jgi:hypothetical protein
MSYNSAPACTSEYVDLETYETRIRSEILSRAKCSVLDVSGMTTPRFRLPTSSVILYADEAVNSARVDWVYKLLETKVSAAMQIKHPGAGLCFEREKAHIRIYCDSMDPGQLLQLVLNVLNIHHSVPDYYTPMWKADVAYLKPKVQERSRTIYRTKSTLMSIQGLLPHGGDVDVRYDYGYDTLVIGVKPTPLDFDYVSRSSPTTMMRSWTRHGIFVSRASFVRMLSDVVSNDVYDQTWDDVPEGHSAWWL